MRFNITGKSTNARVPSQAITRMPATFAQLLGQCTVCIAHELFSSRRHLHVTEAQAILHKDGKSQYAPRLSKARILEFKIHTELCWRNFGAALLFWSKDLKDIRQLLIALRRVCNLCHKAIESCQILLVTCCNMQGDAG